MAKPLLISILLTLGAAAPCFALNSGADFVEPGDRIAIWFPVANDAAGRAPLQGAQATVVGLPPWLILEDTSILGPKTIWPGLEGVFLLELRVGPGFPSTGAPMEFSVLIDLGTSDVVPRFLTWTIRSSNGMLRYEAFCVDDVGSDCGSAKTPDVTPPVTTLSVSGPSFLNPGGSVYVSPASRIVLSALDPSLENERRDGQTITYFSTAESPAFGALDSTYLTPFAIPFDARGISYASVDGNGNPEAIRRYALTVDGDAPLAPRNLMALGISPSPWRSAATYALIWQHPPEVSGVGKTYVKVAGASPSVLGPVTSHTVDLGPSAPQGATAVAVWLEDNVQNVDPNNAAVVELRHDSVVPTIAASAPPKAAAAPIAVSFTATEPGAGGQAPTASGVKKTTLWHRTIPAEATCATSPGPWTKGPESIGPGEGGASFSGAFPFTPPADARYCFHVQAEDVAGNKTPDPAATTAAHGETLYDGTPPILSALRVADLSAKQASLAFAGDEPATARVEWGLTSALGNAIPLPEAIAFTADLPGLPSAALIYYKVTLTNRVGGTSASAVQTFSTPLDLAVAASIDSVIYPDQPIVIRLDNPSVSQAAYSIGGSAGPIPVSGSFSLFPPAVPGPATLSITIDGAVYSRAFIVDDPSRNYRVVRKVVGPGGEESSSAVSKILAVPGQPAATGAAPLASDRSQLFLGYLAGIDPMAPGPIADLAAVPGPGRGQVTLSWKAVGDDAGVGRAMVYELRRSASPILTEADFKNATPTSLPVYPAQAGTSQSAVVSGLPDGAQLHFALKALDEVRNAGPLGRVAAAATLAFTASAETVGGAPAFELLSSVAGITVRRVESPGTLPVLRAAAQGFTLGGPLFEVLSPINPLPAPGALTLRYDPAAVGAAEALLKIYRFDAGAGSWELLADSRLEPDRDLVTATVGRFSYITLLAPDVEAPTTELLVNSGGRYLSPDGQTFLSAASRLSLSARDPPVGALPGTGVSRTEYRLDAGAFAAYDAPFTLPEGLRRLEYRSFDLAANTETLRSAVLRLDAAAPRFALSSPEPALDAAGVFTLLSTRAADGGLPRLASRPAGTSCA